MILNRIEIEGFRGFKTKGIIDFAIPNGKSGSGLTIITGRNNAGKSSVLESIRIRAGHQSPSFSEDTRNNHLQEVEIKYTINGNVETIKSRRKGSSESQILNRTEKSNFFVLPSRRAFAPYFGKNPLERNDYLLNYAMPSQRTSVLTGFESRLFKIQEDEKKLQKFNDIFGEVSHFEVLHFPGGITVVPEQPGFPLSKVLVLFNFTLHNSLSHITSNFAEFRNQLANGIVLKPNEVLSMASP